MSDTTIEPGALGLPQIYQVGYMVHDVDATVERMNPLYGPFSVFESEVTPVYHGVESPVHLKIAVGHCGDLEMEFIEYLSGDSPHRGWIEEHGESIMHVAFKVDDVDGKLAELAGHGYTAEWRGDVPGTDIVYAYARSEVGGHYIELCQGF